MPVVIKRYSNRKLYNTTSKRYITLDEIEGLIRQQQDVKVIDNESGNDITAMTLSQIILESEKNQAGSLPTNLLFSLVQSGGVRIDELRRNIFNSLNLTHHYDVEIERRVNRLIDQGELSAEEGRQFLQKMLSAGYTPDELREDIEEKILEFMKDRQLLTKTDVQSLIEKVDLLTKRVDEYSTESHKV